ncbi:MAG: helix-turn-helix transcriptional regulator [Pseudomonadota bacterium]
MFSHQQVWAAIDGLAERKGMSVSRLAREAGLDPTTFNKSKRTSADGRLRWPSTESLAKIMQATHTSTEQFFFQLSDGQGSDSGRVEAREDDTLPMPKGGTSGDTGSGFSDRDGQTFGMDFAPPGGAPSIPLLGLAQAGSGGFFDDAGLPTGEGWDAVDFPLAQDEAVYALEIAGDSMLPLYRDGDRIIVAPTQTVRRGDRVVVRTRDGEVMAKILARQTASQVELHSLNPEHKPRHIALQDIDWMARIIWASQ